MEIPLNTQIECTDGICGRSKYVLINPVTNQVTHLVVKEDSSPNTEYIVPVDIITGTVADTILLRCSKAEMEEMDPFIKTDYIEEQATNWSFGYGGERYGVGTFYYLPYVDIDQIVKVPVEKRQIPPGELAVRRGTRVEATDGYVGKVDEFVVNPEHGQITHLVMREGHLWGQKDVIIPLSAMEDTKDDTVFLKLDRHQIEALPTFPVHRRWS
jgi:sporulation protein YlmC with PRC-barrel domain